MGFELITFRLQTQNCWTSPYRWSPCYNCLKTKLNTAKVWTLLTTLQIIRTKSSRCPLKESFWISSSSCSQWCCPSRIKVHLFSNVNVVGRKWWQASALEDGGKKEHQENEDEEKYDGQSLYIHSINSDFFFFLIVTVHVQALLLEKV